MILQRTEEQKCSSGLDLSAQFRLTEVDGIKRPTVTGLEKASEGQFTCPKRWWFRRLSDTFLKTPSHGDYMLSSQYAVLVRKLFLKLQQLSPWLLVPVSVDTEKKSFLPSMQQLLCTGSLLVCFSSTFFLSRLVSALPVTKAFAYSVVVRTRADLSLSLST